ncbi:hypothetical protein BH11MYX3_BH11MYX3_38920 [soil metagenome]
MKRLLIAALTLTMVSGIAVADRRGGRGNGRNNGQGMRQDRRNEPPRRVNRPGRADRRAVNRGPVRVTNGHYVFGGGVSYAYNRPVIRTRYYNARVRPRLVVENYRAVPGYVWVRGGWTWDNTEWRWGDGYYAADPQYQTYYDDGSYDYSVSLRIGG